METINIENYDTSWEKEYAEEWAVVHPLYEKETGSLIGWTYPNGHIKEIEDE